MQFDLKLLTRAVLSSAPASMEFRFVILVAAQLVCSVAPAQELPGLTTSTANVATTTNPGGSAQSANHIQALPITINRYGFERSTINVRKGSYALDVVNHSNLQQLPLFLERMPGNSVSGQPSATVFSDAQNHKSGRLLQAAKLDPGTYRLRAGGWTLTIQVQ